MDHIWRSTVMQGDHQWKEGFSSSDNPKMGPDVSRARVPITGEIQAEADDLLSGCHRGGQRHQMSAQSSWPSGPPSALEGAWFNVLISPLVGVRCDWRIPVAKPSAHPQSANQENYKRRHPETSEWIGCCTLRRRRGQFENLLNVHREL